MLNNINTMFHVDPTRTLTLRNRYASQMYTRFRKLKGDINKSIITNDCFGLRPLRTNEPINTRQYAFARDPEKVLLFLDWLQKQVDNNILEIYYGNQLGSSIEEAWMNMYIRTSYEKGIERGQQEMRNVGYAIPTSVSAVTAFQIPTHVDRVGLLYTRNFTGLKGITDEMSKQIAIELAEGMALGKGPVEIARKINDRVDKIGLHRAKILAHTEIIRAHSESMLQEFKNWGVVGVGVLAEWVTAGDARVCSRCRPMEGRVFTIERASGMIPFHPLCRCLWLPLDVTDNQKLANKIKEQAA